jgi:hypothetical protein
MTLCSNNHEEVCYEGGRCPVCDIVSDYEDMVENLNDKINSLELDIEKFKGGCQ